MSSEPGAIDRVAAVDHHDPHGVLGAHPERGGIVVRAFRPGATGMRVLPERGARSRTLKVDGAGVFEAFLPRRKPPLDYRLEVPCATARRSRTTTRTRSCPTLGDLDLHLARRGHAPPALGRLGAHVARARRRRGHVLRRLGADARAGQRRRRLQRLGRPRPPDALARAIGSLGALRARPRRRRALQVRDPRRRTGSLRLKADPFAFAAELPPRTDASVVDRSHYEWSDDDVAGPARAAPTR